MISVTVKAPRVVKHPRHKERYATDVTFRQKRLAIARDWRLANAERLRELRAARLKSHPKTSASIRARASLMHKYGLTPEAYFGLLGEQNGLCRICGKTNDGEPLCVDHEHVDGYRKLPAPEKARLVRGLLCRTCNAGIGMLRDNPKLARRAVEYLEGRC